MIRAVLLDLGGPVLNEDAEYASWAHFLRGALAAEGIAVPEGDFVREVRLGIARCDPNAYLSAVWTFVRPDVDRFRRIRTAFREHGRAFAADLPGVGVRPEAREAIPALADRYLLAIAANQPLTALRLIEEAGLLSHFRWRHVSDGMGVAKPSPLFFRMILDGLGVRAEEAVMVGDRLDFDVHPAKLLGMKTVRVLIGPYAGQEPISPLHAPDRTVLTLRELLPALASLPERRDGR
ncbi:HAD family hydrolase [Candidatus Bipolaricaulota bacterium]|nr:HAD family hydrolase [Candidatus Bipolaricaulota bacterium]